MVTFEIRKPTSLEMCDTYHNFCPQRVCHLRSDMLGYILNMSNINAESRVLLVEHTRGMLTGAIIEKEPKYVMRVEFGHESIKINSEILHQFDYDPSFHSRVGSVHGKLLI